MACKKSNGKYVVYMKDRIKEGRKPKTIWVDSKYDASANGTMLLKGIFGGEKVFSYPKSLYAVKDTIDIITERGGNDIVLDFFGGSATTAHAILDLNKEDKGNRRFIICEQMDYIESVTVERAKKIIGSNSFIYCDLAKDNEAYFYAIKKAKTTKELKEIWAEMQEKAFLSYKVDIKTINENMDDYEKLSLEEQKNFLRDVLDKNALYINYCDINDKRYGISNEDKKFNGDFYGDK